MVLTSVLEEVEKLLSPGVAEVRGSLDDGSECLFKLGHIFLVMSVNLSVIGALKVILVVPAESLNLGH